MTTSRQKKIANYRRKTALERKYHEQIRIRDNEIHELKQQLIFAKRPFEAELEKRQLTINRLTEEAETHRAATQDMIMHCPMCNQRHIDVVFADKPHHTHACQHCGHVWRPAIGPTRGVQFLPGFKDGASNRDEMVINVKRLAELRDQIAVVGYGDRAKEIIDEIIFLGRTVSE